MTRKARNTMIQIKLADGTIVSGMYRPNAERSMAYAYVVNCKTEYCSALDIAERGWQVVQAFCRNA